MDSLETSMELTNVMAFLLIPATIIHMISV